MGHLSSKAREAHALPTQLTAEPCARLPKQRCSLRGEPHSWGAFFAGFEGFKVQGTGLRATVWGSGLGDLQVCLGIHGFRA